MENVARYTKPVSGSIAWVFFALNAKPTSMRRALAERLARNGTVVIVDNPASFLRTRMATPFELRRASFDDNGRSWHYQPLYYPERLPVVGKLSNWLNKKMIRLEIEALLPSDKRRIVCYDSPTQHSLVGIFGESLSVYLAIDDRTLTVTGHPVKGELEAEQKLLSKVDIVVCVSQPLADTLRSRVPRGRTLPIYVLPNGYDEHIFNTAAEYDEPEFLSQIPRPRMLVSGHVSDRIDWLGVADAARLRPQWYWVFVGPADAGLPGRIAKLLGRRGYCHPEIALTDVPAWIHHSDACAVPYRLNDFTCASSPLKAIEYLAMGAPILSTRVPSLGGYGDVVFWVEENDGMSYARALDKCLNIETEPRTRQARIRAVADDSWAVRTDQFTGMVLNGNT